MTVLAKRLSRIKPSPTLAVASKSMQLKAQGLDVISLGAGEPDFDTPDNIKAAAYEGIKKGATKYTAVEGMPLLKQAVVNKFKRENGIDYNSKQIIISCGAKHVIYNAFMATIDPGNEVIIPAPYWVSYPDMVELAEGKPVFVECHADNDFKLKPSQLLAAINNNTKWLILNSPSNPTGSVYSKDELKKLAEILVQFPHVHVLTDDIYEHIIFDDLEFSTIAQVEPSLMPRVLTVNGVSKSYSMTGWRIGYGAGPVELIEAMAMVQSQSTSNPTSISQVASIEALNGTQDFIKENAKLFQTRRDLVLKLIDEVPLLSCNKPSGAFYVFPNCTETFGKYTPNGMLIKNSNDFAEYILEDALVALVPGTAFGMDGYFRISYATSEKALVTAIKRIGESCAKLK